MGRAISVIEPVWVNDAMTKNKELAAKYISTSRLTP
jgi:hypothetical protein